MAKNEDIVQERRKEHTVEEKQHHLKGKEKKIKGRGRPDFEEGVQYLGFYFFYIRDNSQKKNGGDFPSQPVVRNL